MATPAPLSDLNRRFEIPGIAKIVDGRAELPCVRITSPRASGEIYCTAHTSLRGSQPEAKKCSM